MPVIVAMKPRRQVVQIGCQAVRLQRLRRLPKLGLTKLPASGASGGNGRVLAGLANSLALRADVLRHLYAAVKKIRLHIEIAMVVRTGQDRPAATARCGKFGPSKLKAAEPALKVATLSREGERVVV